jgi:hypothetical protein
MLFRNAVHYEKLGVLLKMDMLAFTTLFGYRISHKTIRTPNKACSGRVGVCAVFKQFSTPRQNPALGVLSRPAHPPLTQAVGWLWIGTFRRKR